MRGPTNCLTDLRRSFPNSEHQFQAHVLSLKCKLQIYQGPDYSLKPMDDAEEILKQIHRQFPQEAAQEREYLANTWKEIRMNKALHDWSMAKYYDRRNEYAAARDYYQRIRDQYSDTSLAGEAAERLEQIADEPVKPDDPVPWLTRMFPTPDREKPLVAPQPVGLPETLTGAWVRACEFAPRAGPPVFFVWSRGEHETRLAGVPLGQARNGGDRPAPAARRCAREIAHPTTRRLSIALLTLGLSAGCAGYQWGQRTLYRPDVQTVHVPIFQSDSFRRNLGERLTEAVVKEIQMQDALPTGFGRNGGQRAARADHLRKPRTSWPKTTTIMPRLIETDLVVQIDWTGPTGQPAGQRDHRPAARLCPARRAGRTVDPRGRPVRRHRPSDGDRAVGRTDRGPNGNGTVVVRLAIARPRVVLPQESPADGDRERHARQFLRRRPIPSVDSGRRTRTATGRAGSRPPGHRRRKHSALRHSRSRRTKSCDRVMPVVEQVCRAHGSARCRSTRPRRTSPKPPWRPACRSSTT